MLKSFPLIFSILFLISCVSNTEIPEIPNLVPSFFEDAIGNEEMPELNDREKLWLLSLPAVITYSNNSSYDTLEFEPVTRQSKEKWKNILSSSWQINNREELLDTISRLEYAGDRIVCRELLELLENPETRQINTRARANSIEFLKNNKEIYLSNDLTAWDLGRNTLLIRWGYQVGYITEEESWSMLLHFGKRIHQIYGSWSEYGKSFRLGRLFWASAIEKEKTYRERTDLILEKLNSRGGLWYENKWLEQLPSN